MEKILPLLLPALIGAGTVRLMLKPVGFVWKLAMHTFCGLVCLWLLNLVSGVTGISFPVNGVTVLVAGFLGLPGVGVLALLEIPG